MFHFVSMFVVLTLFEVRSLFAFAAGLGFCFAGTVRVVRMRKFSHYFCRERNGRAQSAAAVVVAEVRCGIGPVMGVVGYVGVAGRVVVFRSGGVAVGFGGGSAAGEVDGGAAAAGGCWDVAASNSSSRGRRIFS